ncbi:hypothetical protein FQR65_LT20500 [Abscondita terminalis]|nr:hypothetical protein FQR65_LT20500 [Abscondita terminalis]
MKTGHKNPSGPRGIPAAVATGSGIRAQWTESGWSRIMARMNVPSPPDRSQTHIEAANAAQHHWPSPAHGDHRRDNHHRTAPASADQRKQDGTGVVCMASSKGRTMFAARSLRRQPNPERQTEHHTKIARAVSTSARVTIACDQAPIAPMATADQAGDAHAEAGHLPGNQRKGDNRDRRGHPQKQLLKAGLRNIIHRHANALEHGRKMGHKPTSIPLRHPGCREGSCFCGTDPGILKCSGAGCRS